jgi:hypothetical protein
MGSYFTFSVLHTVLPFTNVDLPISPGHFPNTVAVIIFELPLIHILIRPTINSVAVALVFVILAFKELSVFTLPLATTFSMSFQKLTMVLIFIAPDIMAKSMRLIIDILTLINIPIAKILKSLSFFHEFFFGSWVLASH